MLYQDKTLGRPSIAARLTAWLVVSYRRQRAASLDLASMNPHLRRDLGLRDVPPMRFNSSDIFRK